MNTKPETGPIFPNGVPVTNNTLQAALGVKANLTDIATGGVTPRDIRDRFAEHINPLDYGCLFQASDDTAAWALVVAEIQQLYQNGASSVVVVVPAGVSWITTSLEITLTGYQTLVFRGQSAGSSQIVFIGATTAGLHFTCDPQSNVDVCDLTIRLGGTAPTMLFTGLSISYNKGSLNTLQCSIRGVKIFVDNASCWLVCCRLLCAASPLIDGCWFCGNSFTNGTGLVIAGLTAPLYGVDNKVINTVIQNVGTGVDIQGSVQGVWMTGGEILGCHTAVHWDSGTYPLCEYLTITNYHLASTAIGVYSTVSLCKLSNILFLAETSGADYTGVWFLNSGYHSVSDCQIQGTFTGGVQRGIFLSSNNAAGAGFCAFSDNVISGVTTAGITFDGANTTGNTCVGNSIINGLNIAFTNGASVTGNMVVGNLYDNASDINSASGSTVMNLPVYATSGLKVDGNSSFGLAVLPETGGGAQIGGGGQDWASVWTRGVALTHSSGPNTGLLAVTMSADLNGYATVSGLALAVCTTSAMPGTPSLGAVCFVSNGCKPTEATGHGTGVQAFWDGSHWISACSGAQLTS